MSFLTGLLGSAIGGAADKGYEQFRFNEKVRADEKAANERYDREKALNEMRIESSERIAAAQITERRMSDEAAERRHKEDLASRERIAGQKSEKTPKWKAVTNDGGLLGFLEENTGEWRTPDQMANPQLGADLAGLTLPGSQSSAAKTTGTKTGTPLLEAGNDYQAPPVDPNAPSFVDQFEQDYGPNGEQVDNPLPDSMSEWGGVDPTQLDSAGGMNTGEPEIPTERDTSFDNLDTAIPQAIADGNAWLEKQGFDPNRKLTETVDQAYKWAVARHSDKMGTNDRSLVASILTRINKGDTIGPDEAARVRDFLPPDWQQKMEKLIR